MGKTLIETLADLKTQRQAVADAITAKGGTVTSGAKLADLASAVGTITGGGGGGTSAPAWLSGATFRNIEVFLGALDETKEYVIPECLECFDNETVFRVSSTGYTKAKKITFAADIANLHSSFSSCPITEIDFAGHTKSITDFDSPFYAPAGGTTGVQKITNFSMQSAFSNSCNSCFAMAKSLTAVNFCADNGIGAFPNSETGMSEDCVVGMADCTAMTAQAFADMFSTLSQNTSGCVITIKLPSSALSGLTADQIAVATGKGYTITS